jgi:sedoheptulokinase
MGMTPTPYSLGIDIGTTKVAAAIVDAETRDVVAISSLAHESDVQGLGAGRSEQVVSRILSALDRCVQMLPSAARSAVQSIGVTGQMHGVVLWNDRLRETSRLVTWQDQRCLEGDFISRLRKITGDPTTQSGYGTATLAWLAAHEPTTLSRYTAAATIHDHVVMLLTGNPRPFTDPSDAASFGCFNLRERTWCNDLIRRANIPEQLLPEIRVAGEQVGSLCAEFATRWGVPEEIPIGNALGDNQASLFGSLTDPANQLALTIGTGAQLSVVVPHLPDTDVESGARYEFRPYVGGSYIAVVASLSGGRALAALGKALEGFLQKLGGPSSPHSLEAIQTAMHEQGLTRITTDLVAAASLSGERYDISLRGGFSNLSFDNFTIGDMTAALGRGLVTSLKDALPAELLLHRREVVGSGNAIQRSVLMQQIIQESFGCGLKLQQGAETTACGAALLVAATLKPPR